jgi:hypothetical protein
VDGGEDLAVRRLELADLFQRVEELLRHLVARGEAHRHAAKGHVGRQLAGPGFEHRLEGVAVRALVPEELGHVDLAAGGSMPGDTGCDSLMYCVPSTGACACAGVARPRATDRPAPASRIEKSRRFM